MSDDMRLPSIDEIDNFEKEEPKPHRLPSFDDMLGDFDKPDLSSDLDEQDKLPDEKLPDESEESSSIDDMLDDFDKPDLPSDLDEQDKLPVESEESSSIDDIHDSAQEEFNSDEEIDPETQEFEDEYNKVLQGDDYEGENEPDEPFDSDEDFRQVEEDEELEDKFDIEENEANLESEDISDMEYDGATEDFEGDGTTEDDFEQGDMGSLLPGMDPSDDIEYDDEPDSSEDADDKAKSFFDNLKNKLSAAFKKKPKVKGKPKQPEQPKESRSEDNRRSKKKPKPKKQSKPIKSKKDGSSKSNKALLIPLAIVVVIISILVLIYFLWANSYNSIDELETDVVFEDESYGEEVSINFNDFTISGNSVDVTISNESEVSTNSSAYVTISRRGAIPFMGDEINCESDIFNVEPNGEVRETLACGDGLNEDSKYKVSVDIDNF